MRVVSPPSGAEIFSADIVLSLEFLPGIEPSPEHPLWCRFFSEDVDDNDDEKDRLLRQSSSFSNFGSYGDSSEHVFAHAFALGPGAYTAELRLGASWDRPLSAAMVKTVKFALLDIGNSHSISSSSSNKSLGVSGNGSHTRDRTTTSKKIVVEGSDQDDDDEDETTKIPEAGRLDGGAGVVVDAFPFFNEYAVLVLRLLELKDVVDVFVLVESRSTHR
jgi:hypothetical protein